MSTSMLLQIVGTAALAALAAGVVAGVVLRLARRAPLAVHVLVIVGAAIAAVAGGIALTAQAMYISEADTAVALAVTATSGAVTLVMAVVLSLALARDARGLGDDARRLGSGEPVAAHRRTTSELDAVQAELVDSSERLAAAREASVRAEQARRDLVARIAHDLLAPLASIRAIAEALEDGLSPAPERHARLLGSHVGRLHSLVDDLFALSRIDAGTLELDRDRVALVDLVSDVVADFTALAEQHGVALSIGPGADAAAGAVVDVDARQFSRALVNVLVNAIEHSPVGGRIELDVHTEAEHWVVLVRDEGAGFDAEAAEHLFDAGWRGSTARTGPRVELAGGAGLGLAITRAIVEAHGGRVDARSAVAPAGQPGSGAELRVVLPRS